MYIPRFTTNLLTYYVKRFPSPLSCFVTIMDRDRRTDWAKTCYA